jgi:hypothetical protein
MQQKHTSLVLLLLLLNLITYKIGFCQNDILSFKETKDNKIQIDVLNDLRYNLNVNENKIILRGVVFNSGLNQSQYLNYKEKRMSSYNIDGFDIKIQYITNAIPVGITLQFTNADSLLVPFVSDLKTELNIKQSSLLIILSDTSLISYLESNSTALSISPLFKILESKTDDKISAVVYQLTSVNDSDDFFLKLNQLTYNLDRQIAINNHNTSITPRNKNSFEINLNTSLTASSNDQINSFSNKQIGINFLRNINNNKIKLGIGLNYSLLNFDSEDNSKYFSVASQYLDTIYATVNAIGENHILNIISCNAKVEINLPVKSNILSIYFSPFHSVYNQYNSEIINGSILTYGKNNSINEYLYDIEELGLGEKNVELIGQESHYSSLNYGFNLGVSYDFVIEDISISPVINLNYLTLKNKAKTIESFSIESETYSGFFSSKEKLDFFFPSIGLSIKF